jgi:Zn-dependent protease with chaperone function
LSAPPGWYPDPESIGRKRYWDGDTWTDQSRPWQQPSEPPRPQPPPLPLSGRPVKITAQEPRSQAPLPSAGADIPALPGPAPAKRALTPSAPRQASAQPMVKQRHGFRVSAWSGVVAVSALVPVLAGALGIVTPIAYGLYLVWPAWGAVIPFVVWWAPAPLFFFPATQRWIVRKFYGCRQPAVAERGRLEQPWRQVLHGAGVPGGKYQLMVTESDQLNACTAIGRILMVTSSSAGSLPPDRLEPVLAHELGHRLGWRAALGYLNTQLMLPIHALRWSLRAMWSPIAPMWRRAIAWHRPIGFLLTFLLAVAATAASVVAALPAAFAFGAVALARLSTDQGEFHADMVAVRLGLGAGLLAALEESIETGLAHDHDGSGPDHAERRPVLPLPLVRRAQQLRKYLVVAEP